MKRRTSLALLGTAAAAACGEPDRRARVPLSNLPAGGRVVIEHAGEAIELQRTVAGVVARSLTCSHYGCRVEWQPDRRLYVCACHQGMFDPEGHPFSGPPTRPLRSIAVVQSGDAVLVGEP